MACTRLAFLCFVDLSKALGRTIKQEVFNNFVEKHQPIEIINLIADIDINVTTILLTLEVRGEIEVIGGVKQFIEIISVLFGDMADIVIPIAEYKIDKHTIKIK